MEFDANLLDFNLVENNEEIRKSLRNHILHSPGNWVRVFRAGMRVDPSPIFPKLDDLDRVLAERNKTLANFFKMPLDSDYPESVNITMRARCVAVVRCAQAARDILREGFHAPRLADAVLAIQRAFAPGEVVRSIDAMSPAGIRQRFGDPRGGADNVYERLHSVLVPVKAAHPEWLLGPVRDLVGHFLDEGAEWNPFATTAVRSATALTGLLVLNSRQDLPVRLELTARLAESDLGGPDAWLKGFGEFYPDPVTMALLIWDAEGFQSALDTARGYCQTHHPLDPRCDVRWRIEPTDGEATTLPCRITGNSMGLAFSLGLRHLSRPGDPEIDPGIVITGAVTQTGKTAPVGGLSIKLAALERKFLAAVVPAGNKRAVSSSSPRVESNVVGVGTIEEGASKVEELGRNVRVLGKPPKPSKWFVGRTKLLNELHASFERSPRAALFNALSGLGGIGKTETALAYVKKYVSHYGRVLWARAESLTDLTDSFLSFADNLGVSTQLDAQTRIDAVKRQLAQYSNWLLVLDNADDPTLIHEFLPHNIICKVLVTSRASDFQILGILNPIKIDVLDPDDALKLLITRTGRENASEDEILAAKDIARELGYLPLALEQAGAYISNDEFQSFQKYLDLFRKERTKLLKNEPVAGQTKQDPKRRLVATTWTINIKAIRRESRTGPQAKRRSAKAALEILNLSAFLAPERIPFELLESPTIGKAVAEALPHCVTPDNLLNPLRRFSLVRVRDDETYDMHRLVQVVTQDGLTEDQHRFWLDRAVDVLVDKFPDVTRVESWPACSRLVPHARAVKDLSKAHALHSANRSLLYNQTGYFLREIGRYAEAEPLFAQALAGRTRVLGPDHPDTLTSLNNLAALYERQGRYAEAEPLFAQALAGRTRVLGPDHPDTLSSLNNLAFLYESQGRYAEAEPLYAQALAGSTRVLGPDHPSTLTSLNNLALLYQRQGRYAEAEPLYTEALAGRTRVLGPDHPDTLSSLNNLAMLYESQGRYAEAEPLYAQALAGRTRVLGPDHPDTLTSLNNLAILYARQGRYAEAEPLYTEALAGSTRVLGPDHPSTLSILNNLAALYESQGRYAEAEPLYAQALAGRTRVLGPDHPDTLTSLNNLAILYARQGRYAEAEPLYLEAVSGFRKALWLRHPNARIVIGNFANFLRQMGRDEEAAAIEAGIDDHE